jgi:iron complex outermembrane receptor protein
VKAQEAWTGEVGARGHRGPFTYDVTLYRAHLQHELLQFAVDSQHPASTFNADKTVHQGIEAALDWAVAPRWRLRQTWTLSDFRFDGDAQYGDNRLPIVPKTFYRAELRYDARAAGSWPRRWSGRPPTSGSTTRTPRPPRPTRSSTSTPAGR